MTDMNQEALDALQERLRRIEWGVTGEPCAAGNVDETAALEADTAITALRAQLVTARADAVRVKPLVWEKSERGVRFEETTCGAYVIFYRHCGGSTLSWGATCETVAEFEGDNLGRKAKAAAQADYEARILAALEPTPSAPSPETPFITSAHREGYLVCLPPRGPAKLSFATPSAPSPEAVARAALEWAAKCIECGCRHGVCEYPAKCPENDVAELVEAASDPATLAAIIAKAGDAAI